jgi:hypothetical protein
MILHLVCDEKFIDYAINLFGEVAPLQNEFLAVIPHEGYRFMYIKQTGKLNTFVSSEAGMNELVNKLAQYDAIIFHSLFPDFFHKVLDKINNSSIKLVWLFWGGEFYEHPAIRMGYQGQLTHSTYQKSFFFRKILSKIKQGLKKQYQQPDIISSARKMTHIVTAFPEDYDTVCKVWQCNAQWMWWNYYSIEETVGTLIDKETNGADIFLGNSATLPNNHIEVLSVLQRMNLGQRKVFIPLSYGNPRYAKFVTTEARNRLGINSMPLLKFLERDEYNKIILGCSVVIMNHYRQQAVGNIVTALWLGAKIYMSEKSPVYRHFTKLGAKIYTVEADLNPENPDAFTALTRQEKENNRKVIYQEYSRKNMLEKTRLIVDRLLMR